MDDEIELISDGDGLAVIGSTSAVARFLESKGWLALSEALDLTRLSTTLQAGAEVANIVSRAAAQSGRWLKLTAESAADLAEMGLMETETDGVAYAMLGKPGDISKWIRVVTGPDSLLTNPAVLSGVSGVMSQAPKQREAAELQDLLVSIDAKLDRIRKGQRDEILSKLDGVDAVVREAEVIRANVGRVLDVTWSTVAGSQETIGEVQSSAVRELDALAEALETASSVRALSDAADEAHHEVNVWLAVLAKTFQLKDEIAVLGIDRVIQESPEDLDDYRRGLDAARQDREALVLEVTGNLISRMEAAVDTANSKVILHAFAARSVVKSINSVATSVDAFHRPLGINKDRETSSAERWRDALRDRGQWANVALEAGPKVIGGALAAGGIAVSLAFKRRGGGGEA